jgi:hypothetical protein
MLIYVAVVLYILFLALYFIFIVGSNDSYKLGFAPGFVNYKKGALDSQRN